MIVKLRCSWCDRKLRWWQMPWVTCRMCMLAGGYVGSCPCRPGSRRDARKDGVRGIGGDYR